MSQDFVPSMELNGRTAVVTGGGTGIGRAIALGLARYGAEVVVNYSKSQREAEETVAQIESYGRPALACRADVRRWPEVKALFEAAIDRFGHVDILVNNAGGIVGQYATPEMPEEVWDQTFALNVKSVFLCSKAAIPLLPDKRGRIINVTSISARSGGGPKGVAYAAAKAAVSNMTRALAKELAPRGITVNAIAPGFIETRLHAIHTTPQEAATVIERIPLGRAGQPGDIAGVALLLASAAGGYITGEIIEVNGGLLMA